LRGLQGLKTEEHPVTEELDRIKSYMAKLKNAAGVRKNMAIAASSLKIAYIANPICPG
jgi:hypothetical protein